MTDWRSERILTGAPSRQFRPARVQISPETDTATSRRPSPTEQGRVRGVLHLRALSDNSNNGCLSRSSEKSGCGDEQTLQQTYSRVSGSARCVQNFDDSLSFAIRMTYRISLRSSSLWEPRHPLLKVFYVTSYSLPNPVKGPSEYNEFTIKMLVGHHTSRKWII